MLRSTDCKDQHANSETPTNTKCVDTPSSEKTDEKMAASTDEAEATEDEDVGNGKGMVHTPKTNEIPSPQLLHICSRSIFGPILLLRQDDNYMMSRMVFHDSNR